MQKPLFSERMNTARVDAKGASEKWSSDEEEHAVRLCLNIIAKHMSKVLGRLPADSREVVANG